MTEQDRVRLNDYQKDHGIHNDFVDICNVCWLIQQLEQAWADNEALRKQVEELEKRHEEETDYMRQQAHDAKWGRGPMY